MARKKKSAPRRTAKKTIRAATAGSGISFGWIAVIIGVIIIGWLALRQTQSAAGQGAAPTAVAATSAAPAPAPKPAAVPSAASAKKP